ncbi:MAG: hypothetical protein ACOCV1_04365 [Bacillota bacterium]
MVNKKDRRNSGRTWPRWVQKGLDLYVLPFWDEWNDWRDGMRFIFSKSWKDTTKKRKQFLKNKKYINRQIYNKL